MSQHRCELLTQNPGYTLVDQAMPQKRRAPPSKRHNETLGERLARLRHERGLSQMELARRLDISQSNISDYERDLVRLHSDLIVSLTKILGVSSDELLGIEPTARSPVIRDRRLAQRLALIDRLPKRDKDALVRTITTFLAGSGRATQRAAST